MGKQNDTLTELKEDQTMPARNENERDKRRDNVVLLSTALSHEATTEICYALRQVLADVFALYLKTKNFHWHMSGIHFRDYHLLLDEHASQIFAMTDVIAERARKLGGSTIHSIGDISRNQRLIDNDEEFVAPRDMLVELFEDNQQLAHALRSTHKLCEFASDVATASLIEIWIDETERRQWFLAEIVREF